MNSNMPHNSDEMAMFFWVLAPCGLVGRFPQAKKMQTVWFSETLMSTDESTRRQNSEEQHRRPHHRENRKSRSVGTVNSLSYVVNVKNIF
jgi:hypothetical protein